MLFHFLHLVAGCALTPHGDNGNFGHLQQGDSRCLWKGSRAWVLITESWLASFMKTPWVLFPGSKEVEQLWVESQTPFCPWRIHRYSGWICAVNSNFDQSLISEGHKPFTKLGWIWQAPFAKKPNKTNKPSTGGSFLNFKTFHSKVFSKQRGWLHVGGSEMSRLEVLLKNLTFEKNEIKL